MIFDIAKKVAYAACELDWLRKVTFQAAASEAESHINTLHECAMELAGNRACEIYTDPCELYSVQKSKIQSEPPVSAQVIEFCGHRECDKP
jgi:hypothetical protein